MKTEIVKKPKEKVDTKTGRRWIQDHESVYDKAIKKYLQNSQSPNKSTIVQYLADIRLGDRNVKKAKRAVTKSRCLRIFPVLQNIDLWLGQKPFNKVTVDDMKTFVLNLKEDIIVSPTTKRAYSEASKPATKAYYKQKPSPTRKKDSQQKSYSTT